MRLSILRGSALALLLAASTALAATFTSEPTVSDQGTTLRVQGTVQDLGSGDVTVRVRAVGTAQVSCLNPSGNEAPGQSGKTVAVTVVGVQTIPAAQLSGNSATLDLVTREARVSARRAGCPNARWQARVDEVTFETVQIRVVQNGRTVLQRNVSL